MPREEFSLKGRWTSKRKESLHKKDYCNKEMTGKWIWSNLTTSITVCTKNIVLLSAQSILDKPLDKPYKIYGLKGLS